MYSVLCGKWAVYASRGEKGQQLQGHTTINIFDVLELVYGCIERPTMAEQ